MLTSANSKLPVEPKNQQVPAVNCRITIIKNLADIGNIRSTWEEMQRNESFPVPNADVNRYVAVMKAMGDQARPYIVLVEHRGRPAAMAIGRREQCTLKLKLGYKTLFSPVMRCVSVVYGGILGQPSSEVCTVLVGELMNALSNGEADMALFNRLRVDSQIYKTCRAMPHFLNRNHFPPTEPHWQTHIPDTVEEFYSRIPASRRHRWRRNIKRLERVSSSKIKVVCYRHHSDIDYLMDVACRIEKVTYKDGLGVGFDDSVVNRTLLEQAAEDGWLKAYILYVGDEPCAFQFDVQYGSTQFSEYGSYDPKWHRGSPGIVLLTKVLEQLCQEPDIRTMDYGFGDALYKKKFGANSWSEESVYIYAPRLRPVLVNMAMSADLAISRFVCRAAECLKLDSWAKRNWRRMLRPSRSRGDTQEKSDGELS